ncbi:hypothetical protein EX30DRAFT_343004 [Ascodesmis nigricans]|uniref:Uncharacterized protein n=1 Tax=Ascodesmis nigricans TaxID=341454 RepID=A0A4S2MSE2_9PEZI|nr:hypothetical protein EX30DRAFT_343004 [Ascodesmis nigricans]
MATLPHHCLLTLHAVTSPHHHHPDMDKGIRIFLTLSNPVQPCPTRPDPGSVQLRWLCYELRPVRLHMKSAAHTRGRVWDFHSQDIVGICI